jgi:hypothetical protein
MTKSEIGKALAKLAIGKKKTMTRAAMRQRRLASKRPRKRNKDEKQNLHIVPPQ